MNFKIWGNLMDPRKKQFVITQLALLGLAFASVNSSADERYPPPRFTVADRVQTLQKAFPAIDDIFRSYATDKKIPGMVWGIVIDGQLAHVGSFGVQDLNTKKPVTQTTVFRIASMTKSFTALSVLKLRDQGKLSLEDPVTRWIPEFAKVQLPTRDSPPVKIRQLMSHSTGLPEDNPWADQQLAASGADVTRWLLAGVPFSTPPGTRYEYSNFAFGLLGRIVTKASGASYDSFVEREIPWAHFDLNAWNSQPRPGRPEGGEARCLLAAFDYLQRRFAKP